MNDLRDAFKKAGYQETDKRKPNMPADPGSLHGSSQKVDLSADYTTRAEKVIIDLQEKLGRKYDNFTTSKIRNILAMVSEIYNDVMVEPDENLSQEIQSRIEYMKVRLVYECGREPGVIKPFVQDAGLLNAISDIGSSRKKFIQFSRYMEALVAFHRFHGGRD